ncbi:MAG: helix-turn-helix domain-containing protein [Clostridia bacterium]|nr:helix-turn-helix domain-containing protein [Clostridia bacterium]
MTFGEIFKENRKRLSLTQEEIALRLMVTPQAVSKWETNQGSPDISLLIPISEEFGITVDELLGKSKKTSEEIKGELEELKDANNELIEDYKQLQKMIRSNPTNTDILLSLLEHIVNILKNKIELSEKEKSEYVKDAEMYSKTLIERGDKPGWDKHGYGLLAQAYMHAGDYDRAKIAIENLPWTKFNRYRSRGDLAFIQKDYETACVQYENSLKNSLSWVFYELRRLYGSYSFTDAFKAKFYAETMYRLHKAFFDIKTETVFIWAYLFACMELAVFHANWGDKKTALTYLEEYADAVETHADLRSKNAESKSAVFPHCTTSQDKIDYDYIKKTFSVRKGLNPIRGEQRFCDILKRL